MARPQVDLSRQKVEEFIRLHPELSGEIEVMRREFSAIPRDPSSGSVDDNIFGVIFPGDRTLPVGMRRLGSVDAFLEKVELLSRKELILQKIGDYALITGQCYQFGIGTDRILGFASADYEISAAQGNAYGQYRLAECYEYGIGIGKNPRLAFENYQASAAQGNAYGQYRLAECYEYGIGVDKDLPRAFENYRLSAAQGNSYGQYGLARCYQLGIGVGKPQSRLSNIQSIQANLGFVRVEHVGK